MKYSHAEFVIVFKALADETRLKILEILSCGELCACKILEEFNITQPTLSYHMKILTESGLVVFRKEGSWIYYNIALSRQKELELFLSELMKDKELCICRNKGEKT